MSDEPQFLRVEGLHTYYGQSHILRGISLAIAQRQSVGLMGRNGMGKTTLIRSIMGLVPPRRGRLWIDGRDASRDPAFLRARAGLAYVPEGRGIFASLSVAEHLAVAERPGADGRADWTVTRVLELFPRLAQRLDHSGAQLSGGEQQMLAIARALLTNPRLLILDEATEGLAPIVREEIWRTIRLIRDSGIATLVVDKSVSDVAALADSIIVLVKGEIAFEGRPAELQADPELMHRHLGV
ncbi:MAG: ABC transporter ATP-binding protein [Hyphomicrobiaceae bacterium]